MRAAGDALTTPRRYKKSGESGGCQAPRFAFQVGQIQWSTAPQFDLEEQSEFESSHLEIMRNEPVLDTRRYGLRLKQGSARSAAT